ncbi:hypothetical protein DFH06DRAFT_1325110 [Mycena polygramma]|nr:hypothetical protein DFH06DRAFT_1325110 [Mycena polygramma]
MKDRQLSTCSDVVSIPASLRIIPEPPCSCDEPPSEAATRCTVRSKTATHPDRVLELPQKKASGALDIASLTRCSSLVVRILVYSHRRVSDEPLHAVYKEAHSLRIFSDGWVNFYGPGAFSQIIVFPGAGHSVHGIGFTLHFVAFAVSVESGTQFSNLATRRGTTSPAHGPPSKESPSTLCRHTLPDLSFSHQLSTPTAMPIEAPISMDAVEYLTFPASYAYPPSQASTSPPPQDRPHYGDSNIPHYPDNHGPLNQSAMHIQPQPQPLVYAPLPLHMPMPSFVHPSVLQDAFDDDLAACFNVCDINCVHTMPG